MKQAPALNDKVMAPFKIIPCGSNGQSNQSRLTFKARLQPAVVLDAASTRDITKLKR